MHLNNAEVVSFNSRFPFLSRELDPQFFSVITPSRECALVCKKYYNWSSMIGIRNMSVVLVGAEAKKIWKGYWVISVWIGIIITHLRFAFFFFFTFFFHAFQFLKATKKICNEFIFAEIGDWNWKHCNEIIFKCINSIVRPIFN